MKKSLLILVVAVMPLLSQSPAQIAQDIKNLEAALAGSYSNHFFSYVNWEDPITSLTHSLEVARKLGEVWALPSPEEFKKGMETYTAVVEGKIPTTLGAKKDIFSGKNLLEQGADQIPWMEKVYEALRTLVPLLRSITPADITESKKLLKEFRSLLKENGINMSGEEHIPPLEVLTENLFRLIEGDGSLTDLGNAVFAGDKNKLQYAKTLKDFCYGIHSLAPSISAMIPGVIAMMGLQSVIPLLNEMKIPTQAEINAALPDDLNKILAIVKANKKFMSQHPIPKEFTGPNPAEIIKKTIEKNVAENTILTKKYLKLFEDNPVMQQLFALQDKLGGKLLDFKWNSNTPPSIIAGAIKDLKAKQLHSKL